MHKDLLAQSPLLYLPIVAMLVFFAVFVVVTIHALSRKKTEMAEQARLPLEEETP